MWTAVEAANLPLYKGGREMVTILKRIIKLLFITLIVVMGVSMLTACTPTTPAQYTGNDADLKRIYDLGLVDKNTSLEGEDSLTWAQALMLASRAHAKMAGKDVPQKKGEWYESYIKYAKKNLIIEDAVEDASRPVLKHELAQMFAAISKLPEINDIDAVPDAVDLSYSNAVLSLYKQGVTLGVNERGDFIPGSNVTAKDAGDMLMRILGEDACLSGKIDKTSNDDAYDLVLDSPWRAVMEGLSSGWTFDNVGGVPINSLKTNYGYLADISDKAGTALIRHLNKISTGIITLDTIVTVDDKDGAYLEYRNEADKTVWQIMLKNGAWNYKNADGTYTELVKLGNTLRYEVHVLLDLDNCRSTLYLNGVNYGPFALCMSGDECNIYNFRYATTDDGKPTMAVSAVRMHVNYALYEDFSFVSNQIPFNWVLDGATGTNGILSVKQNGNAKIDFAPVSGNAIAEFMYLYGRSNKLKYTLSFAGTPIAVLTANEEGFIVNGEQVYACDYDNLWYRFRFEFDFNEQKVLVKVNGREAKTVPVLTYATAVDGITVENMGETPFDTDNFKVFRRIDHEDYVPEPVVPEDKEDNIVGMNVCSLWRNGEHFGWSCVSPYDDITPVLGYYDEGVPETADWEIKYIVEHGIDFQTFCIYMDQGKKAQRPATKHLYDGFMNAKYSSLSKFSVIWECQNAGSPYSMEEWQEYYVPYFIENYFRDPRYMTIDNRPVLCVFGAGSLAERLGGNNNVKHAFEYLEEEIKKYGYDGMIYLACGSANDSLFAAGFDAAYAYNWGTDGYKLETNTESILRSAKFKKMYTVPTISVGFNSIAWHGTRYPMMTLEDYETAQEWVKNEYLPKYAKEEWQKKLVMLSTWNEYGEGTYIMPDRNDKKFGYLDVLRKAYTSENVDPALNVVPSEAQLYRINHLYPQYLNLLRYNGVGFTEDDPTNVDNLKDLNVIYKVDFSKDVADYGYINRVDNITYDKDGVSGTATSSKATIVARDLEQIDLSKIDYICIRAKLEEGNTMRTYILVTGSNVWEPVETDFITVPAENGFKDYYIYVGENSSFKTKLRSVRIDPCSKKDRSFTITSYEFVTLGDKISKSIDIDGNLLEQKLAPFYNEANEICVAFDPATGFDFALSTYHVWNKSTKTLTLYFVDHTVVYQVGSDVCVVDGEQIKLSCKLADLGGLPLIPIKQLCDIVGYKCELKDMVLTIATDKYEYYHKKEENTPGCWEFNSEFNTEGWQSYNMFLQVEDGYMSCVTTTESYDPIIYYNKDIELNSSEYTRLECRVRYDYDFGGSLAQMVMYFATDKDGGMDERKTLKMTFNGTSSNGEWETYSLDLTQLEQWSDTIVSVRFDPLMSPGTIDIDYLRFVK